MKIDTLDIKGFGKFKGRKFSFNPGMNVVFGENEAGKSTLQTFIRAMFFSPRSIKQTDALKRYEPWHRESFGGSLLYELQNGKAFRIERDFRQNELKIYDSQFNEISEKFEISREKGPLFAKAHLGVNEHFFDQTVFVKQMETRLSLDARKNVIESAMNLLQTGMENTSLERILEELNGLLRVHIGNSRTRTRPLEQVAQEIDDKKQQYEEFSRNRDAILKEISGNAFKLEKIDTEKKKSLLNRGMEIDRLRVEVHRLLERKDSLENVFRSLEIRKTYAREMEDNQERYVSDLMKEQAKLEIEFQQKLKKLEEMELDLESSRKYVKKAEEYKEKIEVLLKIQQEEAGIEKEIRITDILFRRFHVAMPTLFAVLLYFIFRLLNFSQLLISGLLLFAIFYPSLQIILEYKARNDEKHRAMQRLADIYRVLGVKEVGEFYSKLSEYEMKIGAFERLSHEVDELESRSMRLKESIEKNLSKQLPSTAVSDEETEFLEKKQELLALDRILLSKQENLGLQMKNYRTLCEQEGCSEFADFILGDVEPGSQQLQEFYSERLKFIAQEQEDIFVTLKANELALKSLEEIDVCIAKLEEEIRTKEQQKKKMEDMHAALTTAISVFRESAEELKNHTMPRLIQNFCETAEKITGGRYKNLSMDDKFEMKALEPYIERIVDVTTLSGGTLDQIYLALRIAMAESVVGAKERLPLILDEVFAHYDDERTRQSCLYLKDLSIHRQIILFTCKTRELELAEQVFGDGLHCLDIGRV